MGYNGRMTARGLHSLASRLLKEKLGYSHEVADRQLAHVPKGNVDRAQLLPQSTEMMQRYANHIDSEHPEGVRKIQQASQDSSV